MYFILFVEYTGLISWNNTIMILHIIGRTLFAIKPRVTILILHSEILSTSHQAEHKFQFTTKKVL